MKLCWGILQGYDKDHAKFLLHHSVRSKVSHLWEIFVCLRFSVGPKRAKIASNQNFLITGSHSPVALGSREGVFALAQWAADSHGRKPSPFHSRKPSPFHSRVLGLLWGRRQLVQAHRGTGRLCTRLWQSVTNYLAEHKRERSEEIISTFIIFVLFLFLVLLKSWKRVKLSKLFKFFCQLVVFLQNYV